MKSLRIRKDTLAALTHGELADVAGGATLAVAECYPLTRFGSGACAHTAFDCLTRYCD